MYIGVHVSFQISVFMGVFFWKYTRSGIVESYGSSLFSFFEKPPYCFPQWLLQFTLPPTVHEGSFFSTPSQTLFICVLFDDSHSDRCVVISHFGYDLLFPDD